MTRGGGATSSEEPPKIKVSRRPRKDFTANFRVPLGLWERFSHACEVMGYSKAEALCGFIEGVVDTPEEKLAIGKNAPIFNIDIQAPDIKKIDIDVTPIKIETPKNPNEVAAASLAQGSLKYEIERMAAKLPQFRIWIEEGKAETRPYIISFINKLKEMCFKYAKTEPELAADVVKECDGIRKLLGIS